jgi:Uncharacterized protein conserved in bacteria (DUF2188)
VLAPIGLTAANLRHDRLAPSSQERTPLKEQAVSASREKAKSDKTEHVIHKQNEQIEGRRHTVAILSGRG